MGEVEVSLDYIELHLKKVQSFLHTTSEQSSDYWNLGDIILFMLKSACMVGESGPPDILQAGPWKSIET